MPDIILLHIGTNNLGLQNQSPEVAFGHLKDLVGVIVEEIPHARLLVATIIGSDQGYGGSKHAAYNNLIREMGSDLVMAGHPIEIVDMEEESGIGEYCDELHCCYPPLGVMTGVHPNYVGYQAMAQVWHHHLTK